MMSNTVIRTMGFSNRVYQLNPWAIDTLKLIALFAMLIDHTNTILSLHHDYLRIIGRTAFPLFGLIWAHNWVMNEHKPNRQKAVNRMWIWSLITQPFYVYALADKGWTWHDANILFCFATASQVAIWLRSPVVLMTPLAAILVLITITLTEAREYGAWGMLFLLACYTFYSLKGNKAILITTGTLVLCCAYSLNFQRPTFALASAFLPLISMFLVLLFSVLVSRRYLPSQLFYYAYAGHLVVLTLIATTINH
ncbi:TraX family protein [Pseudomonas sp. P5_152]|uniref:TraX family protein n=1 Tax=Pseudomonas sp. P5_152 TaxID=3043442 RepID=UPI002A36F356|nr:TraX family protein [Pseudomonas sp. P5_152]MDX9668633.1 TraX family protein [Pseudomonas sp. P5_152]